MGAGNSFIVCGGWGGASHHRVVVVASHHRVVGVASHHRVVGGASHHRVVIPLTSLGF